MKLFKLRVLPGLLIAVLCVATFSITAFASDGGYYASNENEAETPPDAIEDITISTENVGLESDGSNATTEVDCEEVDLDSFFNNLFDIFGGTAALTPVGNLTLIDDILQNENTANVESVENELKSKQFITVQSKNGNYFYIIIDRSGNTENVYFLNLVDEADLLALMEDGEQPPAVCSCKDKCFTGSVNITCEICAVNMTECVGKEPEPVEQEKPIEVPKEEPAKENNMGGVVIAVLILAAGGGAAYYYFVVKNGTKSNGKNRDDDEYDKDGEEYAEFERYEPENEDAEDDGV